MSWSPEQEIDWVRWTGIGEEEDDETKNHIQGKKRPNNAMIYIGGRKEMPGGQKIDKWTECTE